MPALQQQQAAALAEEAQGEPYGSATCLFFNTFKTGGGLGGDGQHR
jgi:hypothetical protein